jgi:hypothetical protein
MKMQTWMVAVLVSCALGMAGCSKSGGKVDAGPVEKSFASAEPALKSAADKAVTAVKSADYSGALAELNKLAANAKLTDDQKKAVTDVLAQLQKAIADAGSKAAGDATKAVGDVQKSLGK